ncbi:MAG: hypothetical protein ACOH13_07175 [Flavobacteriales bacterium]
MNRSTLIKLFLLAVGLLLCGDRALPCSAYKVTVGPSTRFGMNYDTWFEHPRIWFETTGYGAAFTGANDMGAAGFSPQAGMNVYGFSFGTLATRTPDNGAPAMGKKPIPGRVQYLKDILHTCRTVEEVKAYIEQYDHSALSNDVFLYTDRSGKYLIVEPYTLTLGDEASYVISNFCPSTVSDFHSITQQRYINGTAFLQHKIDTSLAFCTALSDTMHVCRAKYGDGTLLTSIWDLQKGNMDLYFYHDYTHPVHFNLAAELARGDHAIEIPTLFPPNTEYQQLLGFKTPLNSSALDGFLRFCMLLFLLSAIYFPLSFFRDRRAPYSGYKWMLAALGLAMTYYMFKLAMEIGIFYFPAPYREPGSTLLTLAGYLPFVILVALIPMLLLNRKVVKEKAWRGASRWLITLNSTACLALVALFAYWGLYNVLA